MLLGAVGALAVGGQLHVAAHRTSGGGLVARHRARPRRTTLALGAFRRNCTITVSSHDSAVLVVPEFDHPSLRSSVLRQHWCTDLQVAENYIKLLVKNNVNIKTPREVRFI